MNKSVIIHDLSICQRAGNSCQTKDLRIYVAIIQSEGKEDTVLNLI